MKKILGISLIIFGGLLLGWATPNPMEIWEDIDPVKKFSVCYKSLDKDGMQVVISRRERDLPKELSAHPNKQTRCASFSNVPAGYYDVYIRDWNAGQMTNKGTLYLHPGAIEVRFGDNLILDKLSPY